MAENRTFDRNAKGVREVLNIKYDTFPFEGKWRDAFDLPERKGVWLIWGNSANGKPPLPCNSASTFANSDGWPTTVWKKGFPSR